MTYKVLFYPLRNQWAVEYDEGEGLKTKFFASTSVHTRTKEVEDFVQELKAKAATAA